ncbi:hypothetical protein JG688_00011458 [Phytophthora aleatoria]|uniref:Uncharacterized protein n=1 Tax=Phytophthora aleatoria TaxID=2496075 RepID=A0A8J5IGS9_9STRA|nr:hypothetical protein JG688_00011458 [Phytophthora aleatoria]
MRPGNSHRPRLRGAMANLGVNIDAVPYASMAPIDHSELRFDGAFAKAASGYKDGWHDDWRSM